MNYNKKSIEDIDVAGKRVLCRCDFNVPTKGGVITSDKRIVAAMPTIKYLVDKGAKVILCSHMGKPKGEWKPELSLKIVADRLSQLLGKEVIMAADVAGEDSKAKAAALNNGDVMLLENTRYIKGETKNDPELSRALADLADVFVNDAFGTAHRAHSSTAGVVPARFSGQSVAVAVADGVVVVGGDGAFKVHPSQHFVTLPADTVAVSESVTLEKVALPTAVAESGVDAVAYKLPKA